MSDHQNVSAAMAASDDRSHELLIFMKGIKNWFASHPRLSGGSNPTVHSVKARLKNRDHLEAKIARKQADSDPIDAYKLFTRVTDLAGVRALHLYQQQAKSIHAAIVDKVENQRDWVLNEKPRAYTWDPDSKDFFAQMGLDVQSKDPFYTSVHYLVRPRADSPLCCEIQARPLFDEIWAEVDHALNYPIPSDNVACREQLRILTKVVGAGGRLMDAIFWTAASAEAK